jgi:hypothetical protein
LKQTQEIGDRRAAPADSLSHFFLSEAKVVDEHTIGLGLFDGTKIGTLDVLH